MAKILILNSIKNSLIINTIAIKLFFISLIHVNKSYSNDSCHYQKHHLEFLTATYISTNDYNIINYSIDSVPHHCEFTQAINNNKPRLKLLINLLDYDNNIENNILSKFKNPTKDNIVEYWKQSEIIYNTFNDYISKVIDEKKGIAFQFISY